MTAADEQTGFAWATAPEAPVLVAFQVDGLPRAKGSMAAALIKRGDGSTVTRENGSPVISVFETGNRNRDWAKRCKEAAREAARSLPAPIDHAVILEVTFRIVRPKKHYQGNDPSRPLRADAPTFATAHQCGDLSKLIRSIEDSITLGGIWADDALVVGFGATTKLWASSSSATVRVLDARR